MCQSDLTEFFAELTEFFAELTEFFYQNSVRLSEFSPPKQYSRNSFPLVSQILVSLETQLASQRDPRGPIPQNCCGDCWGGRESSPRAISPALLPALPPAPPILPGSPPSSLRSSFGELSRVRKGGRRQGGPRHKLS